MDANRIKVGTATGTGAVIRVDVGFQPKWVKVFNETDSKKGTLEWISGMTADYARKNLNDAYQAELTSNGITTYAGAAPGTVLTGTMTISDGAKSITGSGTSFLVELHVGDSIKIYDQIFTVATVTSATAATVSEACVTTKTAQKGYNLTGRQAGFLIGADSDVNGASDSLLWIVAG